MCISYLRRTLFRQTKVWVCQLRWDDRQNRRGLADQQVAVSIWRHVDEPASLRRGFLSWIAPGSRSGRPDDNPRFMSWRKFHGTEVFFSHITKPGASIFFGTWRRRAHLPIVGGLRSQSKVDRARHMDWNRRQTWARRPCHLLKIPGMGKMPMPPRPTDNRQICPASGLELPSDHGFGSIRL